MAGESICKHQINEPFRCIECRIEIAYDRIKILRGYSSKAALYETDMHEDDIKRLSKMLAEGKTLL